MSLSKRAILVDFFRRSFEPAEVPNPVLIIDAERDRRVEEVERAALRALYPEAQVISLPGTNHFAGVLAPPPLVRAIREFLVT